MIQSHPVCFVYQPSLETSFHADDHMLGKWTGDKRQGKELGP